jgi:tetratricopeptide (TPR) repeat protein
MKKLASLLVFFQLVLAAGYSQSDPRIAGLMKEADTLIAASKLSEALAKTEEALSLSHNDIKALQYRITLYYLMQNYKEALRYADEAIKTNSDEAEFFYLRGVVNNSLEKFGKALDDFTTTIDKGGKDDLYKAYLNRGIAYHNLLEYEPAMADFSRSIELNDTIASAYHGRAMLNYELKDYSAAIDDFNKVMDLGQGNAVSFFNMGMCYFRLEENVKACPLFQKSCTMGNKNACRMSLMECVKAIPKVP